MSLVDVSGHRLSTRVAFEGLEPGPSVLRLLGDLVGAGDDEQPALVVRARRGADAQPRWHDGHDVAWRSDDEGIAEVAWPRAGRISGVDGSGIVEVAIAHDAVEDDWMLRTAIGSAACVSGRVLGVHGCVLRAPDGATILLLGPGGSGKTSLSLWLVAWRGYRLLVEDFVYLRHDWSVVTAPVRDFVTLRRWTWHLLAAAPRRDARPPGHLPSDVAQVRAPLATWLHPTSERVVVDAVVRVRRTRAATSAATPLADDRAALDECREVTMTEWLARFALRPPGPHALPSDRRPALLLELADDWPRRLRWLSALEGMRATHAA